MDQPQTEIELVSSPTITTTSFFAKLHSQMSSFDITKRCEVWVPAK